MSWDVIPASLVGSPLCRESASVSSTDFLEIDRNSVGLLIKDKKSSLKFLISNTKSREPRTQQANKSLYLSENGQIYPILLVEQDGEDMVISIST